MEKYYTPEIEEFHPGFVFEWDNSRSYEEYIMESHMLEDINKDLKEGTIRVKHLCREDIEGEGFTCIFEANQNYRFAKEVQKFRGKYNGEIKVSVNRIREDFTTITFEGEVILGQYSEIILSNSTIKNLSEFRRILKQIGV